jgi:hypothetical protein
MKKIVFGLALALCVLTGCKKEEEIWIMESGFLTGTAWSGKVIYYANQIDNIYEGPIHIEFLTATTGTYSVGETPVEYGFNYEAWGNLMELSRGGGGPLHGQWVKSKNNKAKTALSFTHFTTGEGVPIHIVELNKL